MERGVNLFIYIYIYFYTVCTSKTGFVQFTYAFTRYKVYLKNCLPGLYLRDGALEIVIPPLGVFNAQSFTEVAFAALWTSFTAAWTYGAARSPSPVFALFSLPFW